MFALLALASYLLGSVPAAYLAAKLSRGIDIRQFGTGNIGTGNLIKATSRKIGAIGAAFDFFKGMAMVWVAQLLGMDVTQQVVVGLAAIIGHNWTVFLRFNGGRGVVTSFGVAFLLFPLGMPVFAAIAAVSLLLKTTPLPIFFAIGAFPVASWAIGKPLPLTLGLLAIFLIMVIRRLTVPKTDLAPASMRELLINRLLFDRDIRDAKVWMSRRPTACHKLEK